MGKAALDEVGRSSRVASFGLIGLTIMAALGLAAAFVWPSGDPRALWNDAHRAFAEQRYDDARRLMTRIGRLRAPTVDDWFLRAQLSLVDRREDRALDELAHVPDESRYAADARMEAGQLEVKRHRLAAAEGEFLRSLAIDARNVKARRGLIYIYGIQLRRPELNAAFRALAEVSSLTDSEVFLWCLTRGVTWETTEIVETLALALTADPGDRWSRLGEAEGLRKLGRLDEAEATLKPLPEADPEARAARVQIALDRGDDAAAEALLADGPEEHLGLALLRGRFALARREGEEAVHQFRIAQRLAPNLRESIFGLGQALQLVGDPGSAALLDQARAHDRLGSLVQRAATEKNRADPALIRDLGAACAAVGRWPEARSWYNLAITRDPLDAQAQKALAQLPPIASPK